MAICLAKPDHAADTHVAGGAGADDPDHRDPGALQPDQRHPNLDGEHAGEDERPDGHACQLAAPVFSEVPESMADDLRKIPGTRIVAPEVWKISPPIEGRNLLARVATQMLTGKGDERFSSIAETIMIEGMQLPEHLHLKSAVFEQGLLKPEEGGGRYLELDDVGKPNILISTKIAQRLPQQ